MAGSNPSVTICANNGQGSAQVSTGGLLQLEGIGGGAVLELGRHGSTGSLRVLARVAFMYSAVTETAQVDRRAVMHMEPGRSLSPEQARSWPFRALPVALPLLVPRVVECGQ